MQNTIQQFPKLTTRSEALQLTAVATLMVATLVCLGVMGAIGWGF